MALNPLPYRFAAQFVYEQQPESPKVSASRPGVEIALGETLFSEESVGFLVHVTLGLDAELFYAFKMPTHAIVLTVEELGSGRAAALRLVNPGRSYLRPMWPNFAGYSGLSSPVFARGWVSVPLELHATPRHDHPGLIVQAHMREHQSARLHVSLCPPDPAEVGSPGEPGEPSEPDEGEET